MSACPQCGAQIPENGSYCSECGQSALRAEPVSASGRDKVLAALCYFFVPALVCIFVQPIKRIHFIRFHALQSLLTWIAVVVSAGLIKLASMVLLLIPSLGPLITFLLWIGYGLAVPILLLLLIVKAVMGAEFQLPVIGPMAQKQADKR